MNTSLSVFLTILISVQFPIKQKDLIKSDLLLSCSEYWSKQFEFSRFNRGHTFFVLTHSSEKIALTFLIMGLTTSFGQVVGKIVLPIKKKKSLPQNKDVF